MTNDETNPKSEARIGGGRGRIARLRHWGFGLLSSFVIRASSFITFLILVSSFSSSAQTDALRAERVGWARLKTPGEYWRRHATGDPSLMHFLRENTTLNIDPTWFVADVDKLDQLCTYPLLFAQNISVVDRAASRGNLAEYVRRGGFLLIDSCINGDINPDPDYFLSRQKQTLAEILPEARVVALPPDHEIYRCYFQIPGGKPPHTYYNNAYDSRWAKHGLYAIMIGQRMAGLISLSGLQCGWDRMVAPPGHDVACMKMLVNIYIEAMTTK